MTLAVQMGRLTTQGQTIGPPNHILSGAINSAIDQAEGQAPWASSAHLGGLHFLFGDGRVQFLSELIDGNVYVCCHEPAGKHAVRAVEAAGGDVAHWSVARHR